MRPGLHVLAGRVLFHFVEQVNLQSRFLERTDGALRMARGLESGIGDEQDAGAADFAG